MSHEIIPYDVRAWVDGGSVQLKAVDHITGTDPVDLGVGEVRVIARRLFELADQADWPEGHPRTPWERLFIQDLGTNSAGSVKLSATDEGVALEFRMGPGRLLDLTLSEEDARQLAEAIVWVAGRPS